MISTVVLVFAPTGTSRSCATLLSFVDNEHLEPVAFRNERLGGNDDRRAVHADGDRAEHRLANAERAMCRRRLNERTATLRDAESTGARDVEPPSQCRAAHRSPSAPR